MKLEGLDDHFALAGSNTWLDILFCNLLMDPRGQIELYYEDQRRGEQDLTSLSFLPDLPCTLKGKFVVLLLARDMYCFLKSQEDMQMETRYDASQRCAGNYLHY